MTMPCCRPSTWRTTSLPAASCPGASPQETLDFILREMTSPPGGFYAAWDADSEGVEGKYYVWSREEVAEVVGPEAAPLVLAALGVTPAGNFEGANILTRPLSRAELAAQFQLSPDRVGQTLAAAFDRLNQVRARRVPPHRDEKVIVAWNGLAITALALGAQVLGEPRYRVAAARAARFLLGELFPGEYALPDLDGRPGQRPGFLGGLRPAGQRPPGPLRDRF